ncbi:hypothetical protein GR925_25955 [Streptomyces sp. HUCO-GS316]|uniref:hypothetical protein n=1 Tax=Streptomyces sp. HUCO-GS316 TaxID=2692198 RepID=UPI0013721FFD|nr:hypothetical protein [Streptomyces sp. HUCO-GS316]MXM66782.1 hypothetical protein [Streptomyces sp. HUCO-GS316]
MDEIEDTQQQEAYALLDRLTADYEAAERQLEAAREALNKGIVAVLKARTLGPSEVTRHVPYERQHVGRIAKAGGVKPLREPTVVARNSATGGKSSG